MIRKILLYLKRVFSRSKNSPEQQNQNNVRAKGRRRRHHRKPIDSRPVFIGPGSHPAPQNNPSQPGKKHRRRRGKRGGRKHHKHNGPRR